jgi:hypothetical protein
MSFIRWIVRLSIARQPYLIGAWAGFAKGVDQVINAKSHLCPKRALTLFVLRGVA